MRYPLKHTQEHTLAQVAQKILCLKLTHPTRVAIDGVDGVGKTSFANALATVLAESSREIIRVSVDDFHNDRAVRYAKGRQSSLGYYHDSFNSEAVIQRVLSPLGPRGSRAYQRKCHDLQSDALLTPETEHAASDAILIMDGIFLQRPEFKKFWDLTIFLDAPFEITRARAIARDVTTFTSPAEAEAMYDQRYIPGQRLYFAEAKPKESADMVINMTDPARPHVISNT